MTAQYRSISAAHIDETCNRQLRVVLVSSGITGTKMTVELQTTDNETIWEGTMPELSDMIESYIGWEKPEPEDVPFTENKRRPLVDMTELARKVVGLQ